MLNRIYKEKECKHCNNLFTPNSSGHKCCSKQCLLKFKTNKTSYKRCELCNKNFKHLTRVTCSEECYFKLASIKGTITKKKIGFYKKLSLKFKGLNFDEKYGKEKSKNIKQKMSESRIKGWKNGSIKLNDGNFKKGIIPWSKGRKGYHVPKSKGKTFDEFFGKKRSKEIRNKISKTVSDLYVKGKCGKKVFKYNNNSFRSSWEVKTAKWLDKNSIKWEYETAKCRFKLRNDKHLIIDFYLPEQDKFIEVKGWWDKNSIDKCDEFVMKKGFNKLIVVDKRNIDDISLSKKYSDISKQCFKFEEFMCEVEDEYRSYGLI